MDAFLQLVRVFLRRVRDLLEFEGGQQQHDHWEDCCLEGERLYRHLIRIVEAGEGNMRPLTVSLGALIEIIAVVSHLSEEEQPRYTVEAVQCGGRGRPRLGIGRDQLVFLLDHDFAVTDICDLFGVSRSTIQRRLREWGIQVCQRFSRISDAELDRLVTEVKCDFPDAGYRLVQGHLRSRGYSVRQHRVRLSVARVDPEGVAERWARSIPRRVYRVCGPNALWHIDGNHKLIR